jgi:parallel beta-helix repeat protein
LKLKRDKDKMNRMSFIGLHLNWAVGKMANSFESIMKARIRMIMALVLLVLSTLDSHLATAFAQGSLAPPGSPAPTMKSLSQIEPRTPISSLPFTISTAGSYYVTANLTNASGDGITISTNDVTLDLNGFTLYGGTGPGFGIHVIHYVGNLAIRNGVLDSWEVGVDASVAANCIFTGCIASNNTIGIHVGDDSIVKDRTASGNTGDGIYVGFNCIVTGCNASGNAGDGIYVEGGQNRIDGNHASNNSGYGINAGSANQNIIIRNSAPGNSSGAYNDTTNNNDFGPVQTPGTATSPWANF